VRTMPTSRSDGARMSTREQEARTEAFKRYDGDRIIDENTGEETSHDDWGYAETARQAFLAGVGWADAHRPAVPDTTDEDALFARLDAVAASEVWRNRGTEAPWVQPVLQDLAPRLSYWAGRLTDMDLTEEESGVVSGLLIEARNAAAGPVVDEAAVERAKHAVRSEMVDRTYDRHAYNDDVFEEGVDDIARAALLAAFPPVGSEK